ncbi:exodeoxyribonuclease I [Vibrio ulleungensis]|uniref:Exodeoxyribonuclease I n=1 Tax=Vibrio ulleungensis TaxID=2807619 RepID=A0ABS2HFG7_9VIBR|nr:exodeoxyribonuclease I [Vibrio ulleungensis]MBM7035846.1 exodeoxyribonuclease I [Vibrio ulleungensis]
MSSGKTFFFFDYETWGVNPATDRPSQFAGVRCDAELNIIGEPLVIYCQPPTDYLPSPEAVLLTKITPQKARREGLPEPEFIDKIHNELSKPDTISLGYNNVRFDDEVTRYTCYRNFIDPYGWSWQNGNSRWDLLDVMRAVHALRPEGINWPENDDGLPSFKLEHLSAANGIEHENAHDAMADVIATIELAKIVRAAQPKMFDYLLSLRSKNELTKLVDVVKQTPLVHVSGMFGSERGYTSWVVPIAWHPTNKNALIVVDLAHDPEPLLTLNEDEIMTRLYTKRSELGSDLPVPVKVIHLNKCPILAPPKTLTPEAAERLGIDRALCLQHLEVVRSNHDIKEKLLWVFSQQQEYPEKSDVESKLYDGFFSPAARSAMDIIRHSSPEQLAVLDIEFDDPRIAPLLFHYRARHYPHTLSPDEQRQWQAHCYDYFYDRLPDYKFNLEALYNQYYGDESKRGLIESVSHYIESLEN